MVLQVNGNGLMQNYHGVWSTTQPHLKIFGWGLDKSISLLNEKQRPEIRVADMVYYLKQNLKEYQHLFLVYSFIEINYFLIGPQNMGNRSISPSIKSLSQ